MLNQKVHVRRKPYKNTSTRHCRRQRISTVARRRKKKTNSYWRSLSPAQNLVDTHSRGSRSHPDQHTQASHFFTTRRLAERAGPPHLGGSPTYIPLFRIAPDHFDHSLTSVE